ncbi:hypothetical protein ACA910_016510 [Epithemia clementina (nom. ined.)]
MSSTAVRHLSPSSMNRTQQHSTQTSILYEEKPQSQRSIVYENSVTKGPKQQPSIAAGDKVSDPEERKQVPSLPAAHTSVNGSTKPRKRCNPFRIKMGCVVALRHGAAGNNVNVVSNALSANISEQRGRQILPDDSLINVWVDPATGRDEGLALVGKRVRCHFPKHLFGDDKKRRVLEGEVISLVDYAKRKPGKPWKVELLIERVMLQHFPFLTRIDEDVDESKLANDKARRNYRNEVRIRGENMVVVKMRLMHPGSKPPQSRQQEIDCVQWVIQKRVLAKIFHRPPTTVSGEAGDGVKREKQIFHNEASDPSYETNGLRTAMPDKSTAILAKDGSLTTSLAEPVAKVSTSLITEISRKPSRKRARASPTPPPPHFRHIGDGNDCPDQQVANWRWLVSRYHNLLAEVVDVEQPRKTTSTLALVTVKRLVLPEHTKTGRMPYHGKLEIFQCPPQDQMQCVVPVEQLLVLDLDLHQWGERTSGSEHGPTVDLTYDAERGLFRRTNEDTNGGEQTEEKRGGFLGEGMASCHRCCHVLPETNLETCNNSKCMIDGDDGGPRWCSSCIKSCSVAVVEDNYLSTTLPCCYGGCDCRACKNKVTHDLDSHFENQVWKKCRKKSKIERDDSNRFFGTASAVLSACLHVDFALDNSRFIDITKLPAPTTIPVKRVKAKDKGLKKWLRLKSKKVDKANEDKGGNEKLSFDDAEDYTVFKPTCAREASFDSQKLMKQRSFVSSQSTDVPRNLRETYRKRLETEVDPGDKTSLSRAARAKQRRVVKGVANVSGLGLDILASRESQLRFGRSGIHNWGVFADSEIAAGDLIVEYRGEIIGNARAEQREKEYERAKIGSDYMFRIDKDTVCDATKLGNVARFINASCDPNCYTKIITVEGHKRIVIYAKKDVSEGDELCYDYKFPLEYDPLKRIPCHCDSRNCRGFMNWDKRYVVAPDEAAGPLAATAAIDQDQPNDTNRSETVCLLERVPDSGENTEEGQSVADNTF